MKNAETIFQRINADAVREFPGGTVHGWIDEMANQFPDSIAVLDRDGTLTYRELKTRSDQLARYLCARGVSPGDLVGLCCERNIQTPVLMLGIMKTGAGYVPLDPDYPADRLRLMVEDSQVRMIVADESQCPVTDGLNRPVVFADRDSQAIATCAADLEKKPEKREAEHRIAYVIYTSGSTGRPKGVLVPHVAVTNLLHSMLEMPGFGPDDRCLATTTLSFDISVVEIFLPLVAGGSVAIVDRATARDTPALISAFKKHEVTYMQATPAMWRMIVEADFSGHPKLKFVTAGEPLPRDLIQPMLDRCGELWNFYGPTETTVYSTGKQIHSADERILIGGPIANTQVYIVDEDDQLCPTESPGELLIAGSGVTCGYLNRDELNREKFCNWNGIPVYRTGDLAQLTEDGQIDHLGRIDNQIKFNGHRIELGEVETVLSKQSGVRQAAVVLREDLPGEKRLVGYLLTEKGVQPDIVAIRQAAATQLPDYMVPDKLVETEQFFYTPGGKLDRNAFPAPTSARPDLANEFVPATSGDEKLLARIWSELLMVDEPGIHDNFFELGGNSLRAVQALRRIKEQLGIECTGARFFENPTIARFLAFARQTAGDDPAPIARYRSRFDARRDEEHSGYAIVGMAARMPGARDLEQFWQNLVEGKESIRFFDKQELDSSLNQEDVLAENYVAARGIIDDAEMFDARFFNLPPRNAAMTDPQQRIMLELAWLALENAGIIPDRTDELIGIWAGTYSTSYFIRNLLTHPELVRETGEFNLGVMNEKDYIATRVAHALNFRGPAINVNTACSTSLVAIVEACKSLDAGHCDVALAGAASVTFPQRSGHLHQSGSIFSPDGHCRPFDSRAAGTLFSDGAGVVVVKRLADAIRDQDRIYAVVKGFGINNDGGEKASFSAPSISGQANAIAMAHAMGDIKAESIGYIEAHGTATPIGDPIEVAALRSVFESQTERKQFCALGSVKSNIGHTVAAAGVAGLIKVAMSLFDQKIPATLHYRNPNPEIDFESSPFYVCDRLIDWPRCQDPRRAGVSSFGVGGTNAHLVLEEAPSLPAKSMGDPATSIPVSILPVSAKSEAALDESIAQLADHIGRIDPQGESVEGTAEGWSPTVEALQDRRGEFVFRAAVVCDSPVVATEALKKSKPPQMARGKAVGNTREIVFMFPGQGAQYVRMGQNLYDHSDVFRLHLDRCAEELKPLLEWDLREVLFPPQGDEDAAQEILKNTRFTQPALFSLGYSLAQLWLSWGIKPAALIGHSIGEFAAACVAGVFDLETGLKIIAERGRAMQALPGGSMMSVRLPGKEVEDRLFGDLAIGSFNGPELCVVSGPDDQVATLRKSLESEDVACRQLHTSHAFHSPMMDAIVEPFADFVAAHHLRPPATPILSTVTGTWLTDEEAVDPKYWANHLRAPVRFSEAVQAIWDESEGDPSRILVELGPRKTLATLARQHAKDRKKQIAIPTLSDNADDNNEWHAVFSAVAQLWLSGARIDWRRINGTGQRRALAPNVELPPYPFQRKRYFIEPANTCAAETHTVTRQGDRVPESASGPTTHFSTPAIVQASCSKGAPAMSRIDKIVNAIKETFENTSGFDLNEFESDTTFFEMGLDSLLLTQTASALKKQMGVEVTFRQLLEETTSVDLLAEWLDECLPTDQFKVDAEAAEIQNSIETDFAVPGSGQQPVQTRAQDSTVTPCATELASPVTPGQIPGSNIKPDSLAQQIVLAQLQVMQSQMQLLAGHSVSHEKSQAATASTDAASVSDVSGECSGHAATPITPAARSPESVQSPSGSGDQESPPKKAKRFNTVKLNEGELDPGQQQALKEIIRMNNALLPNSKAYAQQHRRYMADPRTVSGFRPNLKEMTHPVVVERSKGVKLWDIDGNEYIDFTCGFGSNFLGHTHDVTVKAITEQVQRDYAIGPQSPLAGEVAKLFCELTGHERMAFSNTGSEAVLGCTRLARNATGRDLIVMFNGDYHGILDEVIARGSRKLESFPAATGVPRQHVSNTLILEYGTDESLAIIRERCDELAGVLVEPVQSRRPEFQPGAFLKELGKLTQDSPTALIFDEVISGFRIGLGGAQEFFGVRADLASYGKIVGGGMPIGVIGGKSQYMDGLDGGYWEYGDDSRPEAGMTYFAGTFVRHPLTLAASKAILEFLRQGGQPLYDNINQLSDYLANEMNQVFQQLKAPLFLGNFGSLFKIQFEQELVYSEIFFAGLRRRGMHIWDHRPCLLTLAHRKEHVDALVAATRDTIVECQRHGFMPGDGFQSVDTTQSPPMLGARQGMDREGNPGWFVPDSLNPGQFLQVGTNNGLTH